MNYVTVLTGLARAKSIPTKTYSNEVVTLWWVACDMLSRLRHEKCV